MEVDNFLPYPRELFEIEEDVEVEVNEDKDEDDEDKEEKENPSAEIGGTEHVPSLQGFRFETSVPVLTPVLLPVPIPVPWWNLSNGDVDVKDVSPTSPPWTENDITLRFD